MDFIDILYQYLLSFSTIQSFIILAIMFFIGPALLIPIIGLVYMAGFLYGGWYGFLFASIFYPLSSLFYYFIGNKFRELRIIRKGIVLIKRKRLKNVDLNRLTSVVLLSLFVPFILLAPLLGAFAVKKRMALFGLYLGAFPSIFISIQAGIYGRSFIETRDWTNFVYSFAFVFAIIIIDRIYKKLIRRNYEK